MNKTYKFASIFLSLLLIVLSIQVASSFSAFQSTQSIGLFGSFVESGTFNIFVLIACAVAGGILIGSGCDDAPVIAPAPVCSAGQALCTGSAPTAGGTGSCSIQICDSTGQWGEAQDYNRPCKTRAPYGSVMEADGSCFN